MLVPRGARDNKIARSGWRFRVKAEMVARRGIASTPLSAYAMGMPVTASLLALGLAGLGIGLAASLTGLGGGFLIVPLLLWRGASPQGAVGTSFVAIALISLSALSSHARLAHVDRRVGLLLGIGGALGAQLGARLLLLLPAASFRPLFALLLLGLAFKLASASADPKPRDREQRASVVGPLRHLGFVALGVGVGTLASLTGLGGGFLMVPLAMALGLSVAEAVGTSFLAIVIIAVSATVAHAHLAAVDWPVGLALGVGGMVGAQGGAHLLRRISTRRFRQVFALLLCALALRMGLGA